MTQEFNVVRHTMCILTSTMWQTILPSNWFDVVVKHWLWVSPIW